MAELGESSQRYGRTTLHLLGRTGELRVSSYISHGIGTLRETALTPPVVVDTSGKSVVGCQATSLAPGSR